MMRTTRLRNVVYFFLATAVACGAPLRAQTGAPTITVPLGNAVVPSGTNLSVKVSVPINSGFSQVGVVLRDPLGTGVTQILTSPPFDFAVPIAKDTLGLKQITAFGLTAPGQGVFSEPISIDVEASAVQLSSLSLTAIDFRFVGDQISLTATGSYVDQMTVDITHSSVIQYLSANTNIAAVDGAGIVTATGGGSTTISVSYGGVEKTVNVKVPNAVRGDLNGDDKVDLDDVNILDSYLNSVTTGPNDARDLNHDGVINALDARILTTLCTYPRCATHP